MKNWILAVLLVLGVIGLAIAVICCMVKWTWLFPVCMSAIFVAGLAVITFNVKQGLDEAGKDKL